jgi:hypothetical protein
VHKLLIPKSLLSSTKHKEKINKIYANLLLSQGMHTFNANVKHQTEEGENNQSRVMLISKDASNDGKEETGE